MFSDILPNCANPIIPKDCIYIIFDRGERTFDGKEFILLETHLFTRNFTFKSKGTTLSPPPFPTNFQSPLFFIYNPDSPSSQINTDENESWKDNRERIKPADHQTVLLFLPFPFSFSKPFSKRIRSKPSWIAASLARIQSFPVPGRPIKLSPEMQASPTKEEIGFLREKWANARKKERKKTLINYFHLRFE